MKTLKQELEQTRDSIQQWLNETPKGKAERIQFKCQIWSINKMIAAINTAERIAKTVKNKSR
jgi:hypothetical protein